MTMSTDRTPASRARDASVATPSDAGRPPAQRSDAGIAPRDRREAALPHDWLLPDWPVPVHVRAFATTRHGGVSTGAFRSLNLGLGGGGASLHDDPQAVAENRRRVLAHLPAAPTWLRQAHGTEVVAIDAPRDDAPIADAAVTRAPGVPLVVQAADCLPVLLADRDGTVAGVAHAGWRGLAAGVIERTVAAMDCDPARIVAWLGPAIGPDAFEVGADVQAAFVSSDPEDAACFRPLREGKWLADLPALARRRLAAARVASAHGGNWCTFRDPQRFFSYRRDGVTGRMAAVLWLE
jgi:YfiH family protein